jgi:hypothetical protein
MSKQAEIVGGESKRFNASEDTDKGDGPEFSGTLKPHAPVQGTDYDVPEFHQYPMNPNGASSRKSAVADPDFPKDPNL